MVANGQTPKLLNYGILKFISIALCSFCSFGAQEIERNLHNCPAKIVEYA